MDNTGSLGSLGAIADGPLADLVRTDGEEAAEVEHLPHGGDELANARVGTNVLLLLECLGLCLELSKALFVRDGDGNDGIALGVLLDPLSNLGEVLILLADEIPLRKVNEVDDGLRGKK